MARQISGFELPPVAYVDMPLLSREMSVYTTVYGFVDIVFCLLNILTRNSPQYINFY
jgi:hypothetical protein